MPTRIPFLDLRILDDEERRELLEAVDTVFRHGRLVMGPEVEELETQVARHCNRRYAVGVNSGTDALFLALKALGIGTGDEVITTSLSWIATANAIALTGATPVFADIRDDLNIDPGSIRRLITKRTKAILPVHYTGRICDMDELVRIADEHRIHLVEDAAQAFGARYRGKIAGEFGVVSCFSMNPMKVLAACGEAGMVLMDSKDLYERTVALRYNGTVNKETCIQPSLNGRLDTLQAAILLRRLPRVQSLIDKRRQIARWYDELLRGIVRVPEEADFEGGVYYTYTVQSDRRDELRAHLETRGIETKIQHPLLMPDQPAYRDGARGEFKNARKLQASVLCIPMHDKLTREDIEYVAEAVLTLFALPSEELA
jgi:dTDP-4-amino-4,6-dideoxygalactose transaminase